MPQNFIACDREQELLLPPSLREWLPEDHLAWFVLATIDEMDLSAFYGAYRGDGHGRAAHEPGMMPGEQRRAARPAEDTGGYPKMPGGLGRRAGSVAQTLRGGSMCPLCVEGSGDSCMVA